jgi:hypothetical protein
MLKVTSVRKIAQTIFSQPVGPSKTRYGRAVDRAVP